MILEYQHFDLLQKAVLERFVFKPPMKSTIQMSNDACFLYLFKGSEAGGVYGSTTSEKLHANEGLLMRCGNYVGDWKQSKDDKEATYEGLTIHFYPEILKAVYEDKIPEFLKNQENKKQILVEKVAIDQMIENYMQSILFYFKNPSLVNDELIRMKVKELILLLVNTDNSDNIKTILQSLFSPQIHSFKQVIHSHIFDDALTIEDLAFLTNHSLSSFKRRFKEVFEDSPAHYIRTKRLEKASELLKTSELNITEIAYDCGFSDISYFGRAFKAHFGMTPSEYRQK